MTVPSSDFWKKQLEERYGLLERAVQKRFMNDPENAEEALSYIAEKIVEDDMRRLKLYDPQRGAKFETYLSVLVQRLISRFIGQKKKRKRFPKWIDEQKNALWLLVYKLLCWEKKSETDVVEFVRTSAPGGRNALVIQEAIQVIHEKYPNCVESKEKEISSDHEEYQGCEELNINTGFHTFSPEEQVAFRQRLAISQIILNPPVHPSNPTSPKNELAAIKQRLLEKFKPATEKRLFLRMIYQDGMSVSEAGRQLGWNANQAAGHHRRLMAQLKKILGRNFEI